MTVNLQTGGYPAPQVVPGVRSADVPAPQSQPSEPLVGSPAPDVHIAGAPKSAEDKRYDQVLTAAKSIFRDVYAVTDKEFTIFKDASGQYITRYTSLRDGRVTYIPEQKLLQAFENSQRTRSSVVEIQA